MKLTADRAELLYRKVQELENIDYCIELFQQPSPEPVYLLVDVGTVQDKEVRMGREIFVEALKNQKKHLVNTLQTLYPGFHYE